MISMRSFYIALLWLALFCFAVSAQTVEKPQSQPPDDQTVKQANPSYPQLVERVKKGDATVDFGQLREAYAEWANDAKNKTDAPNREAMVERFEKEDYTKAAELAEIVLDYEYVNRNLHLAAEYAYRKLGDETKADFHRDVAAKLLKALLSTGDGKSAQTAYRVLNIKEEYLIMRELGFEDQYFGQSLRSVNDRAYDVLSASDKSTGKTVEVYFDINSFFGRGR